MSLAPSGDVSFFLRLLVEGKVDKSVTWDEYLTHLIGLLDAEDETEVQGGGGKR